jgi:hypothetical protein
MLGGIGGHLMRSFDLDLSPAIGRLEAADKTACAFATLCAFSSVSEESGH